MRLGTILVALATTVLIHGNLTSIAGSTGREFGRCTQICNAVGDACRDRCADPADPDACDSNDPACIADCSVFCVKENQDCELVCDVIKEPPSPEEP